MSESLFSRRDLFRSGRDVGGLLAVAALLRDLGISPVEASGAAELELRAGPDVYQSIGVRPLINARGTFTIVSGSLMLPEVRAAMDAAAKHHVHLDELAEAVGRVAEDGEPVDPMPAISRSVGIGGGAAAPRREGGLGESPCGGRPQGGC